MGMGSRMEDREEGQRTNSIDKFGCWSPTEPGPGWAVAEAGQAQSRVLQGCPPGSQGCRRDSARE